MELIDGIIFGIIGAFAGFFLGMMATVLFMASGRDNDGE